MRMKELAKLGVRSGKAKAAARKAMIRASAAKMGKALLKSNIERVVADPSAHVDDTLWGELARAILEHRQARLRSAPRKEAVPYRIWGDEIEPMSLEQMERACRLPVATRGALMPDAHLGYGLPIGGVLATQGAVIPYAVGMDIACRMKMSVLDLPPETLEEKPARFRRALEKETSFGVGATFRRPREHGVMDEDWKATPLLRRVRDKAWFQLGTSGSGNHFVEFGVLALDRDDLGLAPGRYLALLSHSGSRGAGGIIATHYSRLARELRPELPKEMQNLAWFDLDSAEGQEYWTAMQLMGRYAAANHDCIHRHVTAALGAPVLFEIENHHNFAWLEDHDGAPVVVHRKGATPAKKGVLGVIPGSMATPAFVVRGLGNESSLHSAAHGAGRRMSRKKAKESYRWKDLKRFLDERGVELLSAGIDECPMAYKDIEKVMAAQADLVEPIARFEPRLVKMAPAGERPED